MRVIVCGSRDWTGSESIARELGLLPEGTTIIHGGCRGADTTAARIAYVLRHEVKEFRADWESLGKAAGNIRNQQMLDSGRVDLVLAFHDDLAKSKGTKDMVRRAKKAGVEVRVFTT